LIVLSAAFPGTLVFFSTFFLHFPKTRLSTSRFLGNRVLKNKHQAVSQGVRRFGKRSPPEADEHLQKPHNAGSRP
jgi:hypothetical protein